MVLAYTERNAVRAASPLNIACSLTRALAQAPRGHGRRALTGSLQIVDSESGEELSRLDTGLGGAVNDVKVAPNGDVFVTDSLRPVLFRIPAQAIAAGKGEPERIELGPELQSTLTPQLNGVFNANGIVIVDDGTLIVGPTNVDKLYAVDLGDAEARGRGDRPRR